MVERNQVVGKRKTAVARVWLLPGNGAITINRKPMDQYITREIDKILIRQPLVLTDTLGKYDIHVNVRGGGLTGQADAIRHGVSRALISLTPELRPILKKAHLLTRDSRVKERKKYGLRGARARYQYSKR
ncbi:MAG: 30S ribosomal protein S9 [Desulfobacterales bacterium]|nr:30S ribosomal protein S9 [Desulfobacterales bacterium]